MSKRKSRWSLGEFVRVADHPDILLDHVGEIGVVVEITSGQDGDYYKVWFGADPLYFDARWNWRGFFEEWLEPVGRYVGGGKFDASS